MRISYKDYRYILGMKKKAPFIQKLLRYDLTKTDNFVMVKSRIPMWLYVLLFIPVHLITLVMCLWDGGLKEFTFAPVNCATWTYSKDDFPYNRAKEIWEKA